MHDSNHGRHCFHDDDLSKRVVRYLESRHFPRFRELRVQAANGVVTLSGRVDSFHQRQIALNSCRRVAGVFHLIDRVDVKDSRVVFIDSPGNS